MLYNDMSGCLFYYLPASLFLQTSRKLSEIHIVEPKILLIGPLSHPDGNKGLFCSELFLPSLYVKSPIVVAESSLFVFLMLPAGIFFFAITSYNI